MRRQVIKSISIFMICIFVLFATFSACSNDPYSRFDYNVTSFDHIESDVFKANTDIPQRIDSVEQLKEFCNDTGMPINNGKSSLAKHIIQRERLIIFIENLSNKV
ncbi:MAG: hypothetical protein OSJ74_00670 [Clostridia bacterium]|nr:hypothetical protein [Clostridia bacterium]